MILQTKKGYTKVKISDRDMSIIQSCLAHTMANMKGLDAEWISEMDIAQVGFNLLNSAGFTEQILKEAIEKYDRK